MKVKSFIMSAFLLTLASLIAKVLGAVYRIPLTNILGSEGIGLYQLVFPIYSLILVITSLGVPNAMAKIISEKIALNRHYEISRILAIALSFFALLSLLFSVLIYFGADYIALAQGNIKTSAVYKVIAPSIFFVGILSVFRGYFQGYQNMTPTGISMIVEQFVKLIFGLFFAYMLLPYGIIHGAIGAIFGVTLSEIFACVIIFYHYFHHDRKQRLLYPNIYYNISQQFIETHLIARKRNLREKFNDLLKTLKDILKTTIPITLSSMILPLVTFIDSFLIINLLQKAGIATNIATDMYGILTGIVNSLINLPSVIALSVATCIIPIISASFIKGKSMEVQEKSKSALKIVLYIAMPMFVIYLCAPNEIIDFLYGGGLKVHEINEYLLSSNLLKIASITVVFITLIQTITTILQAINKSKIPLIILIIACGFKVALTIILVLIPKLNIFGAMCASIVCYFIACLLNLIALHKYININFNFVREILIPVLASTLMAILLKVCLDLFFELPNLLALILSVGISGATYLIILLISKAIPIDIKRITLKKCR